MKPRITVVGSANTDMVIKLDRIPQPGETVLGGQFAMAAGGKGANQAVAAARAGGDVSFVARVGCDRLGDEAVQGYRRDRIRVEYVVRDREAATGVALVFVACDGENSIAVASGANANLTAKDVERAGKVIAVSHVVMAQLETPPEAVEALGILAAKSGIPFILNPAPAQKLSKKLLKLVSVLTPNETEAALLTEIPVTDFSSARAAATALRDRGVKAVVITLGSKGAWVDSNDYQGLVPGHRVKAVDTTAGGDVFNGALAVSMAEGNGLRKAVLFACAAAAISVTRFGAQPSAPKRAEILRFLAQHG